MRRYFSLILVTLLVCLVASCTAAKEKEESGGPKMVATIKDIMDSMVDPSASYIWESVGTSISAEGEVVKAPRTSDEWKEERRKAILLVEAASLLVTPGRRVAAAGEKSENPGIELRPEEMEALISKDRPRFIQLAKKFQDVSLELLQAVDSKSVEGLLKAGGDLDPACESCHKVYWYPNDLGPAGQPGEKK